MTGMNAIAIVTMLLATSIMNIGMVLQKKGILILMQKNGAFTSNQFRLVIKERIWIAGWLLALVAMVLNCIALSMGNLFLLQPLVGFGLVVMVLFSGIYLKETITTQTIVGISFIISGVILLSIVSPDFYSYASINEITSIYTSKRSVFTYLSIIGICSFLFLKMKKTSLPFQKISFAFIAGTLSVLGISLSKGLFVVFNIAGIINSVSYPIHYILFLLGQVITLGAFVIFQIALSKGNAVTVLPIFHVTTIAMPLFIGSIVFMEKMHWQIIPAMGFMIIGIILICIKK